MRTKITYDTAATGGCLIPAPSSDGSERGCNAIARQPHGEGSIAVHSWRSRNEAPVLLEVKVEEKCPR